MSLEQIQDIIGRALVEKEFCEVLFDDPDSALAGYELTEEEKGALKSIKREKFDTVKAEVEERISRAGLTLSHKQAAYIKFDGSGRDAGIFRSLFGSAFDVLGR